jgi:hypothetical protein
MLKTIQRLQFAAPSRLDDSIVQSALAHKLYRDATLPALHVDRFMDLGHSALPRGLPRNQDETTCNSSHQAPFARFVKCFSF